MIPLVRAFVDFWASFPSDSPRSNHGQHWPTATGVAYPEERPSLAGARAQLARASADLAAINADLAALRAAVDAHAEARADACAGLEHEWDDQPILGRKAAFLCLLPNGEPGFRAPLWGRNLYGVFAVAKCGRPGDIHPGEPAPVARCDCGFHAVPPDMKPKMPDTMEPSLPMLCTLLVELTGRVIECETGYRAEEQTVVEVQLPPCNKCGAPCETVFFDEEGKARWFACAAHESRKAMTREALAAALGVSVTA